MVSRSRRSGYITHNIMALSKSPKKHQCPSCGHLSFTYYVDDQDNIIHPECGRCDREDKCGYHRSPKEFASQKQIRAFSAPQIVEMKYDTISNEIVAKTQTKYEQNVFVQWLTEVVGSNIDTLLASYRVGTSSYWAGSTIFWQIDSDGECRSGKIMLYDTTGHRVKEPQNCVTWAHSAMNIAGFSYQGCLFGEHLITKDTEVVCVVESEKTAIIAAHYMPEYVWVATGGKDCLKQSRNMSGKKVILFPDCKCTDRWTKKSAGWNVPAEVKVCDFLDRYASTEDYEDGADIADYLLKDKEFCSQLKDVIADMLAPKCSFEEYLIDVTSAMEKPMTNLQWDGEMLFSAGNLEVITGAAKSRKTFFVTYLAGQYLQQNPEGQILWIDTEQSKYDAQQMVLRLYRLLGIDKSQNDSRIIAMMLRECDTPKEMVYAAIEHYKSPFIIIDGTADLMRSINDEEDAGEIVKTLMKYSSIYDSTIINVVHQNRNDANTRGWLGSILEKKAESVLLVKSNGDTSKVIDKYNRHLCPVNFDFIVENGLPVRVPTQAEKEKLTQKQINKNSILSNMKLECRYTSKQLEAYTIGEVSGRTVRNYITELLSEGSITKIDINGITHYTRIEAMAESPEGGGDEAYEEELAILGQDPDYY